MKSVLYVVFQATASNYSLLLISVTYIYKTYLWEISSAKLGWWHNNIRAEHRSSFREVEPRDGVDIGLSDNGFLPLFDTWDHQKGS